MHYRLIYSSSARHSLKRLPREIMLKFINAFHTLADVENPRISLKELRGPDNPPFYSLRIGQYRAVMSIVDDEMVIHVIEVGHRRHLYRKC
ncbi:type II toxin-antitoxin system RelE/ParE family toxin [Methanogenium organophilum]|uniref:Type II toxin-antitoxin system RelE/ParE family toxin n=2 Tax=Methanogenium organophilum TaxID=2199 RepID=A0A9X9S5Y5_METOG|nr:type II toxin-antitoxin system RelE/ParE family toxin [Methanogenium organophilum]